MEIRLDLNAPEQKTTGYSTLYAISLISFKMSHTPILENYASLHGYNSL